MFENIFISSASGSILYTLKSVGESVGGLVVVSNLRCFEAFRACCKLLQKWCPSFMQGLCPTLKWANEDLTQIHRGHYSSWSKSLNQGANGNLKGYHSARIGHMISLPT